MPHTATPPETETMNEDRVQCLQECLNCHMVCLQTVTYCLEMGEEHAEADHIRLLLDCAEICQTSTNFMLRNSDQHGLICGVCAEICNLCAEDCERFSDDNEMQLCVQACRTCAESCEQMVNAMAM